MGGLLARRMVEQLLAREMASDIEKLATLVGKG